MLPSSSPIPKLHLADGIRKCRLDNWANVYDAPTAQPGRMALDSSVFRGMKSLDLAIEYACTLSDQFKALGAPDAVYVVRGPTSTTSSPFEVVTATCGYSVAYSTRPQWGHKLKSILAGMNRPSRIAGVVLDDLGDGRPGPVGWVGLVEDPVARDIMGSRYVAGLEREVRRLGIGDLDCATPIGAGASSVALALGDKVLRIGLGALPDRPAIPEVLQAEMAGALGDLRYEVLPRVDTASVMPEHLAAIQISLAMRGYEWGDEGLDNIGLIDGVPVIFDSHGVKQAALAASHGFQAAPGGAVGELAQERLAKRVVAEGEARDPLIQALFDQDEVNGPVPLPGVPHNDIVACRNGFASIYGWTGDGTGRTRVALQALKDYADGDLEVHDPGEPGTPSRSYWEKMAREGLVTALYDELGEQIELTPEPPAEPAHPAEASTPITPPPARRMKP